jgi:hypothetical protein
MGVLDPGRGGNAAQGEVTMGPGFDAFVALGQATAIYATARHVAQDDDKRASVLLTSEVAPVPLEVALSERILGTVGDFLIQAGAWLKNHSREPSYRHA